MDGLYFLMSIVGVALVLWWTVQNDRVGPEQPTTGFFAMPAHGRLRVRKSYKWRPAVETASADDRPPSGEVAPASRPPAQVPWPRS